MEMEDEAFSVVCVGSPEAMVLVLFERGDTDVLFDFAASVDFADDILRHLLTNPYEALTVVDRNGYLRFVSPIHERFFGLRRGEAAGKYVTEVIENTRLHEVARTGKAEVGQVQQMRGTSRVVSRMPVLDAEGRVVAAIGQIMFKGPDQLQQLSAEVIRLKSEVTYYQQAFSSRLPHRHGLDRIIGQSSAIRRLKDQITRIAPLNVPVLLVGESGTGKELVAHALHLLSTRNAESMVMVNAAAIPATLVESELFGYEPGSFTGAERKGRRGKFEQAHGGTLFFDEIGDMPVEIQVKLLRVLQDGSFERVGGDKHRVSDFRLVSASNRDFQAMIDKGEFRLDLFYRISAVTLHLPPLRDRLEDIELLANQALYDFALRHTTRQKTLAPDVVPFLQRQSWPGNVRQLMHAVETAAIFSDSDVISVDDFSTVVRPDELKVGVGDTFVSQLHDSVQDPAVSISAPLAPEAAATVRDKLSHVEEQLIREALLQYGGNKKRVAKELGISRSYLYKKLAAMDIS
ncbi:MAG: sigma 54-interacting transcriptional regulator [Ottowia sp.]|uniref:sigma-54 interaction domain-containing protein n=1 Tax=Ottowia sp. TaxID=1898956 RepID=UPI003C750EC3